MRKTILIELKLLTCIFVMEPEFGTYLKSDFKKHFENIRPCNCLKLTRYPRACKMFRTLKNDSITVVNKILTQNCEISKDSPV